MIDNKETPMMNCPICQRPFKKVRAWQEVCSTSCRHKKWQLRMTRKILEEVYTIFGKRIKEQGL
jgi:hypothetical protein